jgi:peptide-methionine (R)-S-oxide reductase
MTRRFLLTNSALGLTARLSASRSISSAAEPFTVTHTDDEWRMLLKPEQYAVLRQSATERPFSSPLLDEHRPGVFDCAGCDHGLFSSETKFDSGTDWPSFWAPLGDGAIGTTRDASLGMIRSARCTARVAAGISGTFSMTGPRSPACAIA